jgi:transaldolase / glucose-6-phosphate isomerase
LVYKLNEQTLALPQPFADEVAEAQAAWRSSDNTRRLWSKDASLWTGRDEADWLGWLTVVNQALHDTGSLQEFGRELSAANFSDVLLLGMGGSSLGPEVLAKSLGSAPRYPRLHVLDSTDPQQVRRFERGINLARTLIIVSSKSGTTLEPNVLMDYFFARVSAAVGGSAAQHFVAITDPGSQLQRTAKARGFRRIFHGIPDIGGRYSVLSHFGMVPLAATGHDVREFLEFAGAMAQACGPDIAPHENPGVMLGLVIGVLAQAGRNKLTIVASPSIEPFGAWAEQLLAESTGKDGKAVIPIVGEPLGEPSAYSAERLFVYLRDAANPYAAQDRAVDTLAQAGHPVARIVLPSSTFLAQEFFRFEIATAVAGAVLGINPFDQPDVEASKIATRAITETFGKTGALPLEQPVFATDGIALYADQRNAQMLRRQGAGSTLESWFKALLGQLTAGDYFALLAFLDAGKAQTQALGNIRTAARDRTRAATCLQFGPRYLHSTGQAYKGGPNSGVFLGITAQPRPDLAIPGRKATFGVIEAAQARGDFRVLAERGRRILHAHIETEMDAGLGVIGKSIRSALS